MLLFFQMKRIARRPFLFLSTGISSLAEKGRKKVLFALALLGQGEGKEFGLLDFYTSFLFLRDNRGLIYIYILYFFSFHFAPGSVIQGIHGWKPVYNSNF